jgi:hypothetical protein
MAGIDGGMSLAMDEASSLTYDNITYSTDSL